MLYPLSYGGVAPIVATPPQHLRPQALQFAEHRNRVHETRLERDLRLLPVAPIQAEQPASRFTRSGAVIPSRTQGGSKSP